MNKKQKSLLRFCLSAALVAAPVAGYAGNSAITTLPGTQQANDKQVSGQVLDENGDPIIGATVKVKGTNVATVTDLDGNFTLLL